VRNANTGAYRSKDPATGANPARLQPAHRQAVGRRGSVRHVPGRQRELHRRRPQWAAVAPARLLFGGALPWEADSLSFTTMAASSRGRSRRRSPTSRR
jgi:beta-glucosidase